MFLGRFVYTYEMGDIMEFETEEELEDFIKANTQGNKELARMKVANEIYVDLGFPDKVFIYREWNDV